MTETHLVRELSAEVHIGRPAKCDHERIVRYAQILLPATGLLSDYQLYMPLLREALPILFPSMSPPYQPEFAQQIVSGALADMRNRGVSSVSVDELWRSLKAAKHEWQNRPMVQYTIIFPFNAAFSDPRPLTVEGREFRPGSLASFMNGPNWTLVDVAAYEGKALLQANSLAFSTLETNANGANAHEAVVSANLHYDLLRASVNLLEVGERFHTQFGQIAPLAKCLPPPLYFVLDESGALVETFRNLQRYEYKRFPLSPQVEAGAREVLEALSRAHDELRGLLRGCLLRFGEATDTNDWPMAFLMFWQILESVALQTRDTISMDRVAARIGDLHIASDLFREVISTVREIRNKLVHSGWFRQDSLDQVNLANWVAASTIRRLLYLCDHIRTLAELEQYYENVRATEAKLDAKLSMVNFIKKERHEIEQRKGQGAAHKDDGAEPKASL